MKYKIGQKVRLIKIIDNNNEPADLSPYEYYVGSIGEVINCEEEFNEYRIHFNDRTALWFIEEELEGLGEIQQEIK